MDRTLVLERAGVKDLTDIMSLVSTTGWPHRTEDVTAAFHLGQAWCARAPEDATLSGIAMWWPFDSLVARVGLVVVAPKARGGGIGRALMQRVLEDVAPRSLMLLATDQARQMYAKLGFKTIGQSQRHEGMCAKAPVADERIQRAKAGDLTETVSIDTYALGAGRGEILKHLMQVGDVVVLKDEGHVTGYAVVRPFGNGSVVGPIVAASEDDAIDLFRAVARPGVLRVDRPADAVSLGRVLSAHGLRGEEVCDEMVRGDWRRSVESIRVFAMASHAWG